MKSLLMSRTFSIILIIIGFCIVDTALTSAYWQHLAVVHHSAFYEADSWGFVSFHWADDSYAHIPFQDDDWKKISDAIFQKKLESMNIK